MDYALNNKRRVVRLVLHWAALYGDLLQEDEAAMAFLEVGHNGSYSCFFILNIKLRQESGVKTGCFCNLENSSNDTAFKHKQIFLSLVLVVLGSFSSVRERRRSRHPLI